MIGCNHLANKRLRLSAAIAALMVGAAASASAADSIELISVGLDGKAAAGQSEDGVISASGRYVAFMSYASNLVAGDKNGKLDVFVRDRFSATTERVSVGTGGVEGNNESASPDISADGRFVAFYSSASNLVPGDTSYGDVFVRDRQTGTTERVSVGPGGVPSNGNSFEPAISADGRFVAFGSDASNLVAGDTNDHNDIFVRDRQTGSTVRVSVGPGGVQANDDSQEPAISADGRFVAFEARASNLVNGDTNGLADVFVRDLKDGVTQRVSVGPAGAQSDFRCFQAAISADGRFVAFQSQASTLIPHDTNQNLDTFVRDRVKGTTRRVSVTADGRQIDGSSGNARISAQGRFIAFSTLSAISVHEKLVRRESVSVRDRPMKSTQLIAVVETGQAEESRTQPTDISPHGRFVVFTSTAANLTPGDNNHALDVFLGTREP